MECSICYDAINESTGCTKLSCSHSFHFSCISSWFLKQETGSCPFCRKAMDKIEDLPREFTYVEEEDEDDDEDEDEDEDEDDEDDEDEEEDELQISRADLDTLLRSLGGIGITAVMGQRLFYEDEPTGLTETDIQNICMANGARIMSSDEWELLLAKNEMQVTIDESGERTVEAVTRTPWHLMVNGQWQTNVMNPEEDTGITASAPPAKANEAIEKIQSVWRGFHVRKN